MTGQQDQLASPSAISLVNISNEIGMHFNSELASWALRVKFDWSSGVIASIGQGTTAEGEWCVTS